MMISPDQKSILLLLKMVTSDEVRAISAKDVVLDTFVSQKGECDLQEHCISPSKKKFFHKGFILIGLMISLAIAKGVTPNFGTEDPTHSKLCGFDSGNCIFKKCTISSEMPDEYFKELDWLEIGSKSDSFLSFNILTVVRISSSNDFSGSFLKLETVHGALLLDEFNLYFDENLSDAFLDAGLIAHTSDIASLTITEQQPSSSIHHECMQKISVEDLLLLGFFIDETEWSCECLIPLSRDGREEDSCASQVKVTPEE
jgi:hypothetical protein